MKQSRIVLLTSLMLAMAAHSKGQASGEGLMVGASYLPITPEMGAFIAGDRNNRRFTEVHDPLYVKAVVLSDPGNSLALLTYDCIGLLYPALLEVRKAVASRIPASEFDPAHIVMASTHTHSGPDVVGIWGPDQMTSGVDSSYMEEIVRKSADAIVSAWENRKAAGAVYAEATFGEDWVYNISDSSNLDRSLTILQFLDQEGQSIATLSNFACHPTIMDATSTAVSADFVSAMYTYLDENLGGANLFLQGAVGGWVQPEHEPKNFESVNRRGGELGMAIQEALSKPVRLESTSLSFKSRVFNLPVSNMNFRLLAQMGVINRAITDSVTTEVAFFSIGNAQFITHPGETTPTHSFQSKKLMAGDGPKFVIGLGMDALGYILTPEFYEPGPPVKHAEYLNSMSVDKEAGPILMGVINALVSDDGR